MDTGENQQGLRKVLDMSRFISISILILHFYFYCYSAFLQWQWVWPFTQRIMGNIARTGLFSSFHKSKMIALVFLLISLMGGKGKKEQKIGMKTVWSYVTPGILFYFLGFVLWWWPMDAASLAIAYISVTVLGYFLILTGGTLLSRIIHRKLNDKDIFNLENETFPQEERLIENEYSINLPARYRIRNKVRNSWINFINMFRALLVVGTPGSR
ncbi:MULTISPECIES: YWFCY domain-containing protein [Chitinophagaceae]